MKYKYLYIIMKKNKFPYKTIITKQDNYKLKW